MSPPLHRKQVDKGAEESPDLQNQESPNDRFRALATKLLQVPVQDVREAERRYTESRKQQKPKTKRGRLVSGLTESLK